MKVPNWQHHSKKEQKRHLKPQALQLNVTPKQGQWFDALRQARKRRNHLKKCLLTLPSGGFWSIIGV